MIQWSAFYPYITHYVQGCPNPTIDTALRDAASELCDESLIWQETHTLGVQADKAEYAIPLAGGADAIYVVKAATPNRVLSITRQVDLDAILSWETKEQDEPTHFFLPDPEVIRLYPIPTTAFDLTVRVAYRPSDDAPGVPEVVHTTWREAIVCGALATLKAIPNQSFSDPAASLYYARKFESGKADARARLNRGFHFGSLRATQTRFC